MLDRNRLFLVTLLPLLSFLSPEPLAAAGDHSVSTRDVECVGAGSSWALSECSDAVQEVAREAAAEACDDLGADGSHVWNVQCTSVHIGMWNLTWTVYRAEVSCFSWV